MFCLQPNEQKPNDEKGFPSILKVKLNYDFEESSSLSMKDNVIENTAVNSFRAALIKIEDRN